MTLQEFKAWFSGFTENMGEKPPTSKQWERIKERVEQIDGQVTTYPVFVERYWPGRYYPTIPWYTTNAVAHGDSYNTSMTAFQSLGRNDMALISAT